MNANQIINRLVRMVIRRLVQRGVTSGMRSMSDRQTPEDAKKPEAPGNADAAKRAKRTTRLMRRIGRF